jgi:3'-phosphoadenosine 5'-phosphosulfate sulfotransferase (PAPS reductase)/FAD synthetase
MANKVRHVLGISGGKDSSALAIYLKEKYPQLDIEYYFCDTDKELKETYDLVKKLELYLGKTVEPLKAAEDSPEPQFDHFLKLYGGYLPSSNARWCTQKLKLEPFERFVKNDYVVSYVAIRGDEDREGYISHKKNIQSIFPFRRNIWSEEIINIFFDNNNSKNILEIFPLLPSKIKIKELIKIFKEPLSFSYSKKRKLNDLLSLSTRDFNWLVFTFLKSKDYPLSYESVYPLLDNEDNLNREDIFRILEKSGIGIPEYYNKIEFHVNGSKGYYSRSRSGCFFCFFQQKIEWVWLFEKHRDLFEKAMEYEKEGYTWMQGESLSDLIKPDRIEKIKEDYIKKTAKNANSKSPYLVDIINDAEGEGCNICFI